jgi:hypothetical protein
MIEISPKISYLFNCPNDNSVIQNQKIAWQGSHVCIEASCDICKHEFYVDLPVQQGSVTQYVFDRTNAKLLDNTPENFFSNSLKQMHFNECNEEVKFEMEVIKDSKEVILINAIDFLFGHCLYKLLHLSRALKIRKDGTVGIVVLVQPFLKWLVPRHLVSEIWTVHLPMSKSNKYYPDLSEKINRGIKKFDKVSITKPLYPRNVAIEDFSGIKPFNFENPPEVPKINFVWREDRLWIKSWFLSGVFRKLNITKVLLPIHYMRVLYFFTLLKYKFKNTRVQFGVTGFGTFGSFPSFIKDTRTTSFTIEIEKALCQEYASSNIVVGIHGSSMILPSAHAGMAVSILPTKRWGNFSQDLLITEKDPEMALFQKRVVPVKVAISELAEMCHNMLTFRQGYKDRFIGDY